MAEFSREFTREQAASAYRLGVLDARHGRIFRASVRPDDRLQAYWLNDYDNGWQDSHDGKQRGLRWR